MQHYKQHQFGSLAILSLVLLLAELSDWMVTQEKIKSLMFKTIPDPQEEEINDVDRMFVPMVSSSVTLSLVHKTVNWSNEEYLCNTIYRV